MNVKVAGVKPSLLKKHPQRREHQNGVNNRRGTSLAKSKKRWIPVKRVKAGVRKVKGTTGRTSIHSRAGTKVKVAVLDKVKIREVKVMARTHIPNKVKYLFSQAFTQSF